MSNYTEINFATKVKIALLELVVPLLVIICAIIIPTIVILRNDGGFTSKFVGRITLVFFIFLFLFWFYIIVELLMVIIFKKTVSMMIFKTKFVKHTNNKYPEEPSLADMIAYCLITITWILLMIITVGIFIIIFAMISYVKHKNITEKIMNMSKVK